MLVDGFDFFDFLFIRAVSADIVDENFLYVGRSGVKSDVATGLAIEREGECAAGGTI